MILAEVASWLDPSGVAALVVALTGLWVAWRERGKARAAHERARDIEVRQDVDARTFLAMLEEHREQAAQQRVADRLACDAQLDELRGIVERVRRDRAEEISNAVVGRLAPMFETITNATVNSLSAAAAAPPPTPAHGIPVTPAADSAMRE